jgi:hypothetical protein
MSPTFSMNPTSQEELDEMTATPLDFIRRKLTEAELHIPNVHEVKQIAEKQELEEADYFMVLAYRAVASMAQLHQETALKAQNEANDHRIISQEGAIIVPR